MPEGDTLVRTADGLRPYLIGRAVNAASARAPGPRAERLVGATVTGVEAQGKNLLIRFDNGLEVRTHLRMHGSWHRYRPGERWRLAAGPGAARHRGPGIASPSASTPRRSSCSSSAPRPAPGAVAARPGPAQGPVRRRRGAAPAPGPVPGGPVDRGGAPGPARARRHRQRGEERGPVAGAGVTVDARPRPGRRRAARAGAASPATSCARVPRPAAVPATSTGGPARPCPRCGTIDPRRAPGPGPAPPHVLVPDLPAADLSSPAGYAPREPVRRSMRAATKPWSVPWRASSATASPPPPRRLLACVGRWCSCRRSSSRCSRS